MTRHLLVRASAFPNWHLLASGIDHRLQAISPCPSSSGLSFTAKEWLHTKSIEEADDGSAAPAAEAVGGAQREACDFCTHGNTP